MAEKIVILKDDGSKGTIPVVGAFFDSSFQVKRYLKPDGETETTSDDPEAIPEIGLAGPAPEVLPTPVFGTLTKSSTGYSLPVTNKPDGAAIIWTDNGVTQPGEDTPLARTGLTPSSVHAIAAKFTKSGSVDSQVAETSVTLDADSGYVVERRWHINLRHQFGDNAGAPWGNVRFDQSGVVNVAASTGTGNIGVNQQVAFSGGTASVGSPTSALYASEVINSGWEFQSAGSTIRISNLTTGKYYQVYVGSWADSNATQKASITVAGENKVKPNYRTWGTSGENEFTSAFYSVFNNKQPTSGNMDIVFNAVDFYNNYAEAIIIEESSVQKP